MPTKNAIQTHEKTMLQSLAEIANSEKYAYYILYRYAPDLLPNLKPGEKIDTDEQLQKKYVKLADRHEEALSNALYYEDVQAAVKFLMQRLAGKRDAELLNKYYELAMSGDTQALKAYVTFRGTYLADDESNELKSILDGAKIPVKDKTSDIDFDDF